MSGRVLVINAFWALMSHVLWRGSLMLTTLILARSFDTTGFAAFSYFNLTVSMLAAYATLGLGVTASKFFAEVGHERQGQDPAPLGALFAVSLLISSLAFLLVLLTPINLINPDLKISPLLMAAGVAAVAIGVVPGGAILGLEQYRQATLVSAASGSIIIVSGWWAASIQAPEVAMSAIVVGAFFQAVGQFFISGRVTGWSRLLRGFWLCQRDLQRIFQFAGPMLLVSMLSATGSWLVGRIILNGHDGERSFALYSIGIQWFSLTLLMPGMVSRVVLPRLVRSAIAETDTRKMLVRLGASLSVLATLPIILISMLFGVWIISIYGEQYNMGQWFIGAFVGAAALAAPANTLGNAIVSQNGQMIWLYLTCLWFVVLISITIVAAGHGAWAGVFAQCSASFALVLFALLVTKKKKLI